jgi:hypothetical protein
VIFLVVPVFLLERRAAVVWAERGLKGNKIHMIVHLAVRKTLDLRHRLTTSSP